MFKISLRLRRPRFASIVRSSIPSRRYGLLIASMLVLSVLGAILVTFWLPSAVAGAPRPFTPEQWQAISDKRAALAADSQPGDSRLARYQETTDPVSPHAPFANAPTVDFSGFSYRNVDDPEDARLDTVNLFFGGVGSAADVAYDMTHDLYGDTHTPERIYPDEGHTGWMERDCGGVGTPQYVDIDGTREPNVRDVESRDIYDPGPLTLSCERDSIGHIFHLRIWDGGWDAEDGNWSVGAAHWDPDDHSHSSRFEEAERLVVLTFLLGDDLDGPYRWFVGDVWIFQKGNGYTGNSGGCEDLYGIVPTATSTPSQTPTPSPTSTPEPTATATPSTCAYRDSWATYIYLIA